MPRLQTRRTRRRLSLTSLIDVIFLLLLFFMLSSSFARFGDMPFMAVGAGAVASMSQTPPVYLRVLPDRIMVNASAVALDDLRGALAGFDATTVLVAPDPVVSAQRLVDVLGAVGDVPGLSLQLIGG